MTVSTVKPGRLRRLLRWLFSGKRPSSRKLPGPAVRMFDREMELGLSEDETVRVSYDATTMNMHDQDQEPLTAACRRRLP